MLLNDNGPDFYCYSSGCLGLVLAAARVDIETIAIVAQSMQSQWKNGQLNSYDLVSVFLRELLPSADDVCSSSFDDARIRNKVCSTTTPSLDGFLPRLHILVSTLDKDGGGNLLQPHVRTATTHEELIHLLKQTTYIPWVTGPATPSDTDVSNNSTVVWDGGFSRAWHPVCESEVTVPLTWTTVLHSLNPGLDHKAAVALYQLGMMDAAADIKGVAADDGAATMPRDSTANQTKRRDDSTSSLHSPTNFASSLF